MAETVTLSFGEYEVTEPTLRGWREILGTVERELPAETITSFMTADDDPDSQTGDLVARMLPVLTRSPAIAESVLAACLYRRTSDGKREFVSAATVADATVNDVVTVAKALLDSGVVTELVGTLKNATSSILRSLQTATPTPDRESTGSGSGADS